MMNGKSCSGKKLITRGDIAIIFVLAILTAVFYFSFSRKEEPGTMVLIYSDNELLAELPLDHDTSYTVSNELGSNTVVVENHQVYVRDADCPDKRCEKQGAVSNLGETIICLPHKLIIEVTNGE